MATIAGSRSASGPSQASSSTSKASHPFTCVTCAIAFRSSELQRAHMRSDWHRYNLKRRVASLPPLSSEVFAEKVLNAQATSSAAAARASFEKTCTACQRTYYSENAYQNHLGSQKHKARAVAMAERNGTADTETASVMSSTISLGEPLEITASENIDDPEVEADFNQVVNGIKGMEVEGSNPVSKRPSRPHHSRNGSKVEHPISPETRTPSTDTADAQNLSIPIHRCLFCNYDSPNLKLSVLHMSKFHGLFVPEQQYLVDLEGLVKYLQAKIAENYECLYCHKLKGSMTGVQTHMRDKGHCMIAFETEDEMIEVGQFYDFSSTYSDEEDDDLAASNVSSKGDGAAGKLGARRSSGDNGENDEGWETDSTASVDTDEIHSVPIDQDYHRLAHHRHHTHHDPRAHKAPDGFHSHAHSHHAAFHSDYELHLPTGRTAGHRSLSRFYRQNLHNHPSVEERQQRLLTDGPGEERDENENPANGRQVARRDEAGMLGVTAAKRKEVAAIQKKEQRRADRSRRHYEWGIQRRANNQKHFRDDNFGTHV